MLYTTASKSVLQLTRIDENNNKSFKGMPLYCWLDDPEIEFSHDMIMVFCKTCIDFPSLIILEELNGQKLLTRTLSVSWGRWGRCE